MVSSLQQLILSANFPHLAGIHIVQCLNQKCDVFTISDDERSKQDSDERQEAASS